MSEDERYPWQRGCLKVTTPTLEQVNYREMRNYTIDMAKVLLF